MGAPQSGSDTLKTERVRRRKERIGTGPCLDTPKVVVQPILGGDEDADLQNPKGWSDPRVNA